MIGPIHTQIPLVGPLRPDAVEKSPEERRIADERSRKVSPAGESKNGQEDEILTAEGEINKFAKGVTSISARLAIEEDQGTGDFIYKIVDKDSGEVIQQFPREELLRRAEALAKMGEPKSGVLVDEKA